MKLEIVTPGKIIKEDNVETVSLESSQGSLGILKDHIPMFAELMIAPLRIVKNGKTESVAVMGGVVRVLSNVVTILTEDAERATEIDVLKAKKEKESAEAYLTKKVEVSDMIKAEVQLRRALVKLRVAGEMNK